MEDQNTQFLSGGSREDRLGADVAVGDSRIEHLLPSETKHDGSSETAGHDQESTPHPVVRNMGNVQAVTSEAGPTSVTIASPQGSAFTKVSGSEVKDPEKGHREDGFRTPEARQCEPKIRTLRDYVESKPTKSPRGIDLEQIKASPRSEDLTKIKFARFVFNGVSTTVVSRSSKNVDGSNGDIDADSRTPASPNKDHSRHEQRSGPDEAAGDGAFPSLHGREDSDDLNLEKLASLTASRPRPIPHQLVQVDDEAWLGNLKSLSRNCIKKIGSESVGQEYTVRLKAATKELDHALRAGLGSFNISGFPQLEKHRWEAVQRLSAILHETHDAEVGLIHSEGQLSVEAERAIWKDEMELCFKEEDAIRQRLREAREEEEAQVRAQWAEKLQQAETDLFQRSIDETLQHNQQLMESMVPLEEESVVRVLSNVLHEQEPPSSSSILSPSSSIPSPTTSEPPSARSAAPPPSAQRQSVASATPRRVTTQQQVREAYALGSPGSLPLEMQADSPRGPPASFDATARLRGGEGIDASASLSSLNFIPENSLLVCETAAAPAATSPNDSRLRFLF